MNDKPKDPLARWWWPGQWLHIVYGVWIDQLWYWENVRPRLHARRDGASLFIQSILGALLVSLLLPVILGGTSRIIGMQFDWPLWSLGSAEALAFVIVIGCIGFMFRQVNAGIVWNIAMGISLGTLWGIVLSTTGGLNKYSSISIAMDTTEGLIAILGLSVVFGIGRGMSKGITGGTRIKAVGLLLEGVAVCTFWAIVGSNIVKGFSTGLVFVFGLYLANRWSVRRAPDEDSRKRLANSNAHPPITTKS